MNIAIYGGSFDPVHRGHIKFINHIREILSPDKTLTIPTYASPLKTEIAPRAYDRLEMCRMAFASPEYEVLSLEIDRGGKSYTYETLKQIREIYGEDNRLYLIIGSDQLLNFNRWYRYGDILSMATLCAVSRHGDEIKQKMEDFANEHLRPLGECKIFDFQPLPVNSTQIREKIKKGEDVSELLTPEVAGYIENRGLYR